MRRLLVFCLLGLGGLSALAAERPELAWPTPSRAWLDGRPSRQWLQHAGSGDPASGGYGGVRNSGRQFHEGIDIRPVARDRQGSPTDPVMAAMAGVVRHVNAVAGDSSYGRYVVLEHPGEALPVYTLYAHLARIEPGLRAGVEVARGQRLGIMGHSSGGYMIPRNRAHLHFEVGVMLSQRFQAWYDRRKFPSANQHGIWNGMNLMGADPLAFFDAWRAGRIHSTADFFRGMEMAVRVRVATKEQPDFVARYPALLTAPVPAAGVAGWEVRFGWTGIPFAWTPLTPSDVAGMKPGERRIVEVNAPLERRERSRSLAVPRGKAWVIGKDLETVLDLLWAK